MTSATFNLENLGLTITFPRSIIRGRFSSLETYAIWQAQSFLKHGKCEDGCVAVLNVAEGMTAGDIKAARQQKRQADGQRRVEEVAPNANEPAIASDGKPAPASAPVESEYEPVGTMPVVGDMIDTWDVGLGGFRTRETVRAADGRHVSAGIFCLDSERNFGPKDKYLQQWRILKRIERASDPLAGAEVYQWVHPQYPSRFSLTIVSLTNGRVFNRDGRSGVWGESDSTCPGALGDVRLDTDQAHEAIESLRRWMEGNRE